MVQCYLQYGYRIQMTANVTQKHIMLKTCYIVYHCCTRVLELYKQFQEEAYSVALHPTGLFILVGFSDKLRLMNLVIDDIRTFKEFMLRSCREVCVLMMCSLCKSE